MDCCISNPHHNKKNKKNFKKVLTNQQRYDIIYIEIKKRGN